VKHPHVDNALKYAQDVVAGKINACKYVKLACRRHLADLENAKSNPSYPYKFDPAAAEKICVFAENLPHVKGEWAKTGQLLTLESWECFILCCVMGWLRKKNGLRRFREVYAAIPRKNGKSIVAAVIGLYMWCMDGEVGAEVYSGATTEKQAWEVFRPARQMVQRSQELLEFVGEDAVRAKMLVTSDDESRFEPVIGKPGDGSSPSCALIDEFHEQDTPDLVDTMQTGMGARAQPLLVQITTAGYNLAGPCYDKQLQVYHVLEGVVEQDELFGIIYSIDEEDDWADPKVLAKANPNYGVSVDPDFLITQQRNAVLNPIDANKFKTKHLNVWCAARMAWMNLQQWHLCGDPKLTEKSMGKRRCIGIIDLASKDDLAVWAKLFAEKINDQMHFWFFAKYYLPEDVLNTPGPNVATYNKWHRQQLLTIHEGAEIDFDSVGLDVKTDLSRFAVEEVVYDSWRANHLAQQLAKDGATMVEMRQTVQNLSAPMKEVLSAVKGARFHHDDNPVTTWMMANVTAKLDAKDNIYPRKEKPQMKIDGAVASIMGMARGMLEPDAGIEGWLKGGVAA
jgi:phage terminase large subunit-like protein